MNSATTQFVVHPNLLPGSLSLSLPQKKIHLFQLHISACE